jgi:hypothetical protein
MGFVWLAACGSDPAGDPDGAVERDAGAMRDGQVAEVDAGRADGAAPDAGPGPSYSPLVVLDFEEGADEEDADWPATSGGPMAYDTAQARSGSTALRVRFRHGENGYGGYQNLPEPIGPGSTVWYRVYLYIPSTTSFSHGDTSGDGFGWNKFLVMAEEDHEPPRMYVQPRSPYMANVGDAQFYGTGLYVNHDGLGSGYCRLMEEAYTFPRDRWFALQMAWHVATDSTAWIRVWSDEEFLGECAGAGEVSAGYSVQSFGIGDYWNGGAWIQGESTSDFWMDDIVVTTETPNTTDAGGRPFIHPSHY